MIGELRPVDAVELAVVSRSGFLESSHLGAAVVLDPRGQVLSEHGRAEALLYPRSTMKLMQAVAVQRLGVILEGEELVLSAASHVGTAEHVRVVRRILQRAGLSDDALQCPAEWPTDPASRRAAERPDAVTMGCSGKHAAFLLTCVANGWSTEDYLDPGHPLQIEIVRTVEEFTGDSITHSGIDGCGAPVHAVSLRGLARAIGRIGRGLDNESARLSEAIRRHPWALDNPAVQTLISETGLIAKSGAEGVFVASAEDGTALAIRVLDGSQRALAPVALSLLERHGVIDAATAERVRLAVTEPVRGGGAAVGELRSVV